jgi:hypothetical protein
MTEIDVQCRGGLQGHHDIHEVRFENGLLPSRMALRQMIQDLELFWERVAKG